MNKRIKLHNKAKPVVNKSQIDLSVINKTVEQVIDEAIIEAQQPISTFWDSFNFSKGIAYEGIK